MRSNLSGLVSGVASRVVSSVADRLARSRPAGIAAGATTALLALSTAAALGISSLMENPGPPPAGGALSAGRNALQGALVVNAGADDPGLAAGAAGATFGGGALPSVGGESDAGLSPAIATLGGGRAEGDDLYERSLAAAGNRAAGGRGGSSLLRTSLGGMMGAGMLATAVNAHRYHRYSTIAMADTGTTEVVTPATPTDPLAGVPATTADTSLGSAPAGGTTGKGAGSGATAGPAGSSDTGKASDSPGKTTVTAPIIAVVTPEPGTFLLLGGGLIALGVVGLRRRTRA